MDASVAIRDIVNNQGTDSWTIETVHGSQNNRGLTEKAFVGAESRLLKLFDLLRQKSEGSQTNPRIRIA